MVEIRSEYSKRASHSPSSSGAAESSYASSETNACTFAPARVSGPYVYQPTREASQSLSMRPQIPRDMDTVHQNASTPSAWQGSTGQSASALPAPVRFNISRPTKPKQPIAHFNPGINHRAFPPPAPPAAAIPSQEYNAQSKWPEALQEYVKQAFARCKNGSDQSTTQSALKYLITNAITSNHLWTKNWAEEPMPTLADDRRIPSPVKKTRFHPVAAPVETVAPSAPPSAIAQSSAFAFAATPLAKKKLMKPNKKRKKNAKQQALALESFTTMDDSLIKNQRRQRFLKDQVEMAKQQLYTKISTNQAQVLNVDGDLDFEAMTIKGTCQKIEKEYLRLTSPPHPSTVRPQIILEKALEQAQSKWKQKDCDYHYACSQLKSIRQDCTVQRIKNAFTVKVYETHARVALESGDINEFNQCQTQLHELYEISLPGEATEFLSYRILYCIYVGLQATKIDSNAGTLGMYSVLSLLSPSLRKDRGIAHALRVREAVSGNNYHRFFKLYMEAPNMSRCLMKAMVTAIRLRALRVMCKAYRPFLAIDFIKQELHLDGLEGRNFVRECGLVQVTEKPGTRKVVDTKQSSIVSALSDQSSLI